MTAVNGAVVEGQINDGEQGNFFDQSTFSRDDYMRPKITVFGVGGAGGNAVNNMIRADLEGVEFVVANTDSQALLQSLCERRIQLGLEITGGLGAGARPDVGRAAAEEVVDDITGYVKNSNMVFITAGMGGGTGTGAAPVIARIAKEHGVLTIGVITKPFHFEGTTRMRIAERGIDDLQQYVDTLIVIPNQNLFRVANERTTFADAFKMADDVLRSGVQGVTDLMVMPGLINLDFADIKTVMSEMGKAMMGTGDADGERRAIDAAEAAISNPLLDDVSMKGAKGILINITGGYDMTLYEVDEAANRIREEVDPEALIIFGSTFLERMNGRMRVSVVATGIDAVAVKLRMEAYEDLNATPPRSQQAHAATTETPSGNISLEERPASSLQPSGFGVVQSSSMDIPQKETVRKKPSSLFERLTGIKKPFSSEKKEGFIVQQPTPQASSLEEDLEIPAFLRKGS
ncbi:MAG: cell division protein FtsZ [Holosporaceae bacterium]|jgi:cell division protein FtsZ|nr:cell division protein FtsZ [Holosporaceae bacterium]